MKIADLDLYLLDPARRGAVAAGRSLLVRLTTADGRSGWGESRTTWRVSELAERRETLLAILAGQSAADIERMLENDALEPAPLRAAIEIACWDLVGRVAGQPLCRLWGGEYRLRIPLAVRLPRSEPDRAAQLARDLAERGFATQVLVATGDVELDVAVVAAVQQAAGDRVELRLDAEGRFAADRARDLCHRLERAGLQFVIDPLSTGLDGLPALARQTTVPLAVSAAIRHPADVLALARAGAAPHVVADVACLGGLWPARKSAIVAAAAGLPASLAGAAGLGVALAATLQLAAATPNLALAQPCEAYQLHEDVLADRLPIQDGMITVPQAPGLGVEVDAARIEAFQLT